MEDTGISGGDQRKPLSAVGQEI
jgi:hypothetical protein